MPTLKHLLINHISALRREWQRLINRYSPFKFSTTFNTHLPNRLMLARRRVIKGLTAGTAVLVSGGLLFRQPSNPVTAIQTPPQDLAILDEGDVNIAVDTQLELITNGGEDITSGDASEKDYLYKMRNFNAAHTGDRILTAEDHILLQQVANRLRRTQTMIGHANFNLLGFDKLLYYSRNYSRIGAFTQTELALLERFFYTDARELGFNGEKVIDKLTLNINKRDTLKIAGSGNYLFKGKPDQLLKKILQQGGDNIILTSGIRGIIKQMHLFIEKSITSDGNLSLASRSLAPPGYSFHGISDFDVGQRGLGYKNFTADFANSDVYHKLSDLGYLTMRYPLDNMLGVRYEPWHVKVA